MILLQAYVSESYVVQRDVPDRRGEELLHLHDLARVLVDQRLLLLHDFLLLDRRDRVHLVDQDEQLGVRRVLLQLLDHFLESLQLVGLHEVDLEDVDQHLHLREVLLRLLQVVVHELLLSSQAAGTRRSPISPGSSPRTGTSPRSRLE